MAFGGLLRSEVVTVQTSGEHHKFLLDLDQADRFGFEIHSENGVDRPSGPKLKVEQSKMSLSLCEDTIIARFTCSSVGIERLPWW